MHARFRRSGRGNAANVVPSRAPRTPAQQWNTEYNPSQSAPSPERRAIAQVGAHNLSTRLRGSREGALRPSPSTFEPAEEPHAPSLTPSPDGSPLRLPSTTSRISWPKPQRARLHQRGRSLRASHREPHRRRARPPRRHGTATRQRQHMVAIDRGNRQRVSRYVRTRTLPLFPLPATADLAPSR